MIRLLVPALALLFAAAPVRAECPDGTEPGSVAGQLTRDGDSSSYLAATPYTLVDDAGTIWSFYAEGPYFANGEARDPAGEGERMLGGYVGKKVVVTGCKGAPEGQPPYVTSVEDVREATA